MTIKHLLVLQFLTNFLNMDKAHELLDANFKGHKTIEMANFEMENPLSVIDEAIWEANGSVTIFRHITFKNGVYGNLYAASAKMEVPPVHKWKNGKLDTAKLSVDFTVLPSKYLTLMYNAAVASGALSNKSNILSIGLGPGSINGYIHTVHKNANITVVEKEPKMVELAEKFFGLITDNRHIVIIDDGIHFMRRIENTGLLFDVIFMDACYNDVVQDVICPVKEFTLKSNVRTVKSLLTKNGAVVGWLLTTNKNIPEKIIQQYTKLFKHCIYIDDGAYREGGAMVFVCGDALPDFNSFRVFFKLLTKPIKSTLRSPQAEHLNHNDESSRWSHQ